MRYSHLIHCGVVIGWLLGRCCGIEMVFSWPGLGIWRYSRHYYARLSIDQGFVLWVALAYMCINALVDASYILLDPRLKGRA